MLTVQQILVYLCLPTLLAIGTWYLLGPTTGPIDCRPNYVENGGIVCKPLCEKGQFGLAWMEQCQTWLTCRDIESSALVIKEPIGNGAVKIVRRVEWKGLELALNTPGTPKYRADFKHGMTMMVKLQPSPFVTQLVGYCKDSYLTEFQSLGSAENLHEILQKEKFYKYNTASTRFGLCVSYANVINFLHNSPIGTRVMCDSNDLQKTLNQFLVTSDFRLLVNDLDALPLVNNSNGEKIKCGHRRLGGDFVAPEQLWPYPDSPFEDGEMPGYDERTDIWKIPDVCDHFLGDKAETESLKFHLFKIHKKCKSEDPNDRPSAEEVLEEYRRIRLKFGY